MRMGGSVLAILSVEPCLPLLSILQLSFYLCYALLWLHVLQYTGCNQSIICV